MNVSQKSKSMQGGYDPSAFLIPIILLGLHAAVQNPKQLDAVSKKIKVSKSRKSSKMSGGGYLNAAQEHGLSQLQEMLGGFSELMDMMTPETTQDEGAGLKPLVENTQGDMPAGAGDVAPAVDVSPADGVAIGGGSRRDKKRSSKTEKKKKRS